MIMQKNLHYLNLNNPILNNRYFYEIFDLTWKNIPLGVFLFTTLLDIFLSNNKYDFE